MSVLSVLRVRFEQHSLQQRWRSLPARDRQVLQGLFCFAVLALLYLGFWRPVTRQLEVAQRDFEQQRELNAYLHAHAPQVQTLAEANTQETVTPDQLQGVVSLAANEQGLQVERFDSEGDGALLVSFQPSGFVPLLGWIKQLEARGVTIEQINLATQGNGLVSIRVLVRP